jgi:hypothetical protein
METLVSFAARIRIDASNPLGAIIISIVVVAAACGIVYWVLSTVVEKLILPLMRVPDGKRDSHVLSKIALAVTGLAAIAGIVMVILPVFGVDTGPVNLLNIVDI